MFFWSSPFPWWSCWLFFILLGSACYSDLVHRKIPNHLNGTLLFSGLLLQGWTDGFDGLLRGLIGILCALLLLLIPFALYLYRGGDVKLCMGCGAWIGAKMIGWTIIGGVILGGIFGLLILAQHRFTHSKSSKDLTVPMALPFCISCIGLLSTWGWPLFHSLWG